MRWLLVLWARASAGSFFWRQRVAMARAELLRPAQAADTHTRLATIHTFLVTAHTGPFKFFNHTISVLTMQ